MITIKQKRLFELFKYNPNTGLFVRKINISNAKVGEIAGSLDKNKYILISIDGIVYKAHHLAILYMTGKYPTIECDHKNGIRDDNRFKNIQECGRQINMMNKKIYKNNSSKISGVHWSNRESKWISRIQTKGKRIFLGSFENIEDAKNAKRNAEKKYNFGENHGN